MESLCQNKWTESTQIWFAKTKFAGVRGWFETDNDTTYKIKELRIVLIGSLTDKVSEAENIEPPPSESELISQDIIEDKGELKYNIDEVSSDFEVKVRKKVRISIKKMVGAKLADNFLTKWEADLFEEELVIDMEETISEEIFGSWCRFYARRHRSWWTNRGAS